MCLLLNTSIDAQQNNPIFSGGGIRTGQTPGALQGSTRAFDFSKLGGEKIGESPKLFNLPKFELPKFTAPKITWPKWMQGNQQGSATKDNPLGQLPQSGLFSPRDPNQPSFFERLNSRAK